MFSGWLGGIIRQAGMSCRPEYYSGRGATSADLRDEHLEAIWCGIGEARGVAAAEAFVSMVGGMAQLSATDFLITLSSLECNEFAWDVRLLSKKEGLCPVDEVTAFCTIADTMFGMGRGDRDETSYIRGAFLKRHGYVDWAKLEVEAREFAARAHRGQKYGSKPYTFHLSAVCDVVHDFGPQGPLSVAAWLHDVVEDTDVTREEVAERFSAVVADLVWAVTGVGESRAERNKDAYAKVVAHSRSAPPRAPAAKLKLADRIANAEQSRKDNPRVYAMYCKEQPGFLAMIEEALGAEAFASDPMVERLRAAFAP